MKNLFYFLLLLVQLSSCASGAKMYAVDPKTITDKYFSQNKAIYVSQKPESVVQISYPQIDGKTGSVIIFVQNHSTKSINFNPNDHILFHLLKNGTSDATMPYSSSEYLSKVSKKNAYVEIARAMSNSTVNQYSGYKSVPYNANVSGTVNSNGKSTNYSVNESGTINYYDQNEVNQRNSQNQIELNQRTNAFNSGLNELDQTLLKANSIAKTESINGYVHFKLTSKNPDKIKISVRVGSDCHEIDFIGFSWP